MGSHDIRRYARAAMHEPPYLGNGAYCYSNSLWMCLRGRAPEGVPVPDPSFLECLSTMPFGTSLFLGPSGPRLFFSPASLTPDLGLERAIEALGWSWEVVHARNADGAARLLGESVRHGPALAGPLDLGLLPYNPRSRYLGGSDHYVTVLGIEGDRVRLHDPQGFPHALLPLTQFLPAWKAERIPFPHQPYTLRRALTPGPPRERGRMIEVTLPRISENLQYTATEPGEFVGADAVRRCAVAFEAGVDPETAAFFTMFTFPLGTRRASDASEFMREAGHPAAAALYREKARRLGGLQGAASAGEWREVARELEPVAELEEKIRLHIGAAAGVG